LEQPDELELVEVGDAEPIGDVHGEHHAEAPDQAFFAGFVGEVTFRHPGGGGAEDALTGAGERLCQHGDRRHAGDGTGEISFRAPAGARGKPGLCRR